MQKGIMQNTNVSISYRALTDARLSMRALGLLVRLLATPERVINSETLMADFDCGREQMRGALNELRDAGYLSLNKFQNESGQWLSRWALVEGALQ